MGFSTCERKHPANITDVNNKAANVGTNAVRAGDGHWVDRIINFCKCATIRWWRRQDSSGAPSLLKLQNHNFLTGVARKNSLHTTQFQIIILCYPERKK